MEYEETACLKEGRRQLVVCLTSQDLQLLRELVIRDTRVFRIPQTEDYLVVYLR